MPSRLDRAAPAVLVLLGLGCAGPIENSGPPSRATAISPGNGWYCYRSHNDTHPCYRTSEMCEKARSGNMGPMPGHTCGHEAEAYCVTWTMEGLGRTFFASHCARSVFDCTKV